MCRHTWLLNGHSMICGSCGLQRAYLPMNRYNKYGAPIVPGYNRATRFKLKVDKLLCIHMGPNSSAPIWEFLKEYTGPMNTPADVRRCLRSSTLKAKHYDCIRIFSNIFTPFRVGVHQVHTIRAELLRQFDTIYIPWSLSGLTRFISYDYLMRRFLEAMNSPLLQYCKPRTCKRRLLKYAELIRFISVPHVCKKLNHDSAAIHSPSVKWREGYLRYPQQLAGGPVGLAGVALATYLRNAWASRVPCRSDTTETMMDGDCS